MAKVQAVDEQCPIELGLNILSGKWKLKILWHLSKGTIRLVLVNKCVGNIYSTIYRCWYPQIFINIGIQVIA